MDTSSYRLQCSLRHPDLQKNMLAVHQAFPPLFTLRNPERGHPPPTSLPQEVQPLVEYKDPEHLALVPKAFWDIPLLYGPYKLEEEGYLLRLADAGDPHYFRVLQVSWSVRQAIFDELLEQWPDVALEVLRWGWFEKYPRPGLFSLPQPPRYSALMRLTLQRLMRSPSIQMVIPIYEDTSLEDISSLWPRIQELKQGLYGKRRARADQYEKRLKVWDTHQECGNFAQVAAHLHMRVSTVKSTYAAVTRDIFGSSDRRTMKERRRAAFDLHNHLTVCPRCAQATTADAFCAEARAYIDQDKVAQHEIPHAHDTLGALAHPEPRKKPKRVKS